MTKRKLTAITPDGKILTRTTHREYSHMVAIQNTKKHFFYPLGWSSWSWSSRLDLAEKKVQDAKQLGWNAVILEVQS